MAAAGGAIYTYTLGTEGWIQRAEGFRSDMWSYVTYETAENGETVDILILSNAQDGMIAVYGSDLRVEKKPLAIGDEYGDVRFAVLGRYAERIWGTGAPGYPDHVFYSRPYNPFDWTGMPDTPQLGGGVIGQPTWDGESFLALHTFGGYLLAIKPSTVFEIRGTDPSCFTISEAYGTDGPLQARTVCTDRTNMLFLAQSGLGLYDGTTPVSYTHLDVYKRQKQDCGQNQFARGEGGLSVTAGTAIRSLQEAGSKITRWHTERFKDAFREMVEQILWVLSEYLEPGRKLRIIGGWDSAGGMRERVIELIAPEKSGDALPRPAYTVRVQVQKNNPSQIQADNEFLMQVVKICAEYGQPLPPEAVIRLMEGQRTKASVLRAVKEHAGPPQ